MACDALAQQVEFLFSSGDESLSPLEFLEAAVYGFAFFTPTVADCTRSAATSMMSLRSQASGVDEVSIVAFTSQLCGSPARRT